MDRSVNVWPQAGETLPANGRVIVSGFGGAEAPVTQIAQQKPVLVSGDEVVPLEVEATYVGNMRVSQVVLKPGRALEVGQTYELRLLAPRQGREALELSLWRRDGSQPARWQVVAADNSAPRWSGPPRHTGSPIEHYGCGPEIHEEYAVEVEDVSKPIRYLATVRRADGTGLPLRQLIEAHEAQEEEAPQKRLLALRSAPKRRATLAVGHGMCSGAFRFDLGVEYRMELFAVDGAGNQTPAPGGAITIVGRED